MMAPHQTITYNGMIQFQWCWLVGLQAVSVRARSMFVCFSSFFPSFWLIESHNWTWQRTENGRTEQVADSNSSLHRYVTYRVDQTQAATKTIWLIFRLVSFGSKANTNYPNERWILKCRVSPVPRCVDRPTDSDVLILCHFAFHMSGFGFRIW